MDDFVVKLLSWKSYSKHVVNIYCDKNTLVRVDKLEERNREQ